VMTAQIPSLAPYLPFRFLLFQHGSESSTDWHCGDVDNWDETEVVL